MELPSIQLLLLASIAVPTSLFIGGSISWGRALWWTMLIVAVWAMISSMEAGRCTLQ